MKTYRSLLAPLVPELYHTHRPSFIKEVPCNTSTSKTKNASNLLYLSLLVSSNAAVWFGIHPFSHFFVMLQWKKGSRWKGGISWFSSLILGVTITTRTFSRRQVACSSYSSSSLPSWDYFPSPAVLSSPTTTTQALIVPSSPPAVLGEGRIW